MKYSVDKSLKKKAYIQLYEQIKNDIVSGLIKCGERLPSKRVIAEETGVSVITVEHCYGLLYEEGYIDCKQRRGYFVIYTQGEVFGGTQVKEQNPIKVNAHNPPNSFPISVYSRLARKVIADYGERLFVKSPNNGTAELRNVIADYLMRSRGIEAEPSQIIIGSGAEYLYNIIVAVLGRDKIYAVETPSYDKIKRVYMQSGAAVEYLKLASGGILSEELKKSKASVLHVTPFESFPSGITATASKRAEYVKWASDRGGYLIEDDFGSEFSVSSKAEDTLFNLSKDGRVIYLNSFSKTIAPSVRVAYMVLPKQLVPEYQKTVGFCSCTVPTFEQYLISEIISGGEFERHINRTRRRLRNQIKQKQT